MSNTVILKKSSVAGKIPISSDLQPAELAVNLVDQKLYSKRTDGTVVLVGVGASIIDPSVNRFSGTGAQTAFTLSAAPVSAKALIVNISGVVQTPDVDFTVSGTTLTFTTAPPAGTNNITVQNMGTAGTVNVPADGSVTAVKMAVGAAVGNLGFTPYNATNPSGYITSSASITGNAATATKLQTARTLTIGSTGKTFDGSANVAWSLAEMGAQPASTAITTSNIGSQSVNYASSAGSVADSSVTYSKIQNVSASKVLGRGNASGSGVVQELPIAVSPEGYVGFGVTNPHTNCDVATIAASGAGVRIRQPVGNASNAILQFTNSEATNQIGSISCDSASNMYFNGLLMPTRPNTSGGVGHWQHVPLSGSTSYLPSGGTWAYFLSNSGSGLAGVAAGGTLIWSGAAFNFFGFCWRIA